MRRYIFLTATSLHFVWGTLCILYPEHSGATPMALLSLIIKNPYIEGLIYIVAASITIPVLTLQSPHKWWLGILCIPQQTLLILAAISSLIAIIEGQYADAVQRPFAFIANDQALEILFTSAHTAALWRYYRTQALWRRVL